jgi:hypothetical protein
MLSNREPYLVLVLSMFAQTSHVKCGIRDVAKSVSRSGMKITDVILAQGGACVDFSGRNGTGGLHNRRNRDVRKAYSW